MAAAAAAATTDDDGIPDWVISTCAGTGIAESLGTGGGTAVLLTRSLGREILRRNGKAIAAYWVGQMLHAFESVLSGVHRAAAEVQGCSISLP